MQMHIKNCDVRFQINPFYLETFCFDGTISLNLSPIFENKMFKSVTVISDG